MTTRRDLDPATPGFDRLITSWFDAESDVRAPSDLLDRTIARTTRLRPRSAWLLPERWIPMELTMRQVRLPRGALYLALVAMLIVGLLIALLAVGAPRSLPNPFGPAANGSIFIATTTGDLVRLDATESASTVVVHDVDALAHPAVSLRGTRLAFVRPAPEGHYVEVVDLASNATIRLSQTAEFGRPHDFAWSPDERQLAWITGGDLWLARTDGSGASRIDVGMVVSDVSWRPPNGSEMLIRAAPAGLTGLYLLHPDGSGLRPITDVDGSEFTYIEPDWSPDGQRLAWSDYPPGVVHVLTIDGLGDVTVPASPGGQGTLFPKWSPDGTRIGLVDWLANGEGRVAIIDAADPSGGMVDVGPTFAQGPDYVWSPDGMKILAIGWNEDQPWLLEPSGGPGQKTSWTLPGTQSIEGGENILTNVWQRLAP